MWQSTKKYGHEVGLSCTFRQWKATSHCNQLHGYALAFKFTFESMSLDHRNWVVDFGGLKQLKQMLEDKFDHKTVIAADDPKLDYFLKGQEEGVLSLTIAPEGVGCEMFAWMGFEMAEEVISNLGLTDRVKVLSCEVSEHGSNSALYVND